MGQHTHTHHLRSIALLALVVGGILCLQLIARSGFFTGKPTLANLPEHFTTQRERLLYGLKMDLQQASINDLRVVPGVGRKLSYRIIAFQKRSQPLCLDEILNVTGIGPVLLRRFRHYFIDECE